MAQQVPAAQEFADYLLCRFVRAAGEVGGRMRMQKAVFLLGAQETPMFVDYFFHLRGPYSPALAGTLGYLVNQGLVTEQAEELAPDILQYSYRLTADGKEVLRKFEAHPSVRHAVALGKRYEQRFVSLVQRDVRELELAATVVYWRRLGYGHEHAVRITAQLKGAKPACPEFRKAMKIVHEVLGHQEN